MKFVAIVVVVALTLSGCGLGGAAKAARNTGATFDKYGCLAKELKGETPCQPEARPE
jgi:hypothetical protein